jgi:subtilase family serine protease
MFRRSRSFLLITLLSALSLFASLLGGVAPALAASQIKGPAVEVCPGPVAQGYVRCFSRVFPNASASPTGLSPLSIELAYNFSTSPTIGAGTTIAIVDAYDDPKAASDLAVFSSTYGLLACTTSNGCFSKVNQTGGTSYPKANSGWALEISLDVQWAHAIAPGAKILLVEATSNSFSNLMTAENYAKLHAQYVSNSWGGAEFSNESSYDGNFVQPGVSFFVAAGDSGLPAEYPSVSPNVISVGGTTLAFNPDGSLQSETGWSYSGGGCSTYETANPVQAAFGQYSQVNCSGRRATPDVSLDANPSSGVSVYDTVRYQGQSGWFTVGGTSASTPVWAARSADAGTVVNASFVYGSNITFRDVTTGNNGAPCMVGYDLVTGRGSWTGITP